MDNRKIRFGILGCGRVSKSHVNAIKKNIHDLDMLFACDVNRDNADKIANIFGCEPTYDLNDIPKFSVLDFVTIATPNGMHAENAMFLMQHGINVVIEKPMSLRVKDAEDMIACSEQHNAKIFVIQQNRYNPTVQLLHDAVTKSRFGQIYMVCVNLFWHRDQSYYDSSATWHGTKDMDGGAFFTQASHYVDLMQWVVNKPVRKVYGNLKTLARNIETEDCGSAILEWEGGTIGSINMTVLTHKDNIEGSITILGEKGTARVGGVALNEVTIWDFEDPLPGDDEVLRTNYTPDSVYGDGHVFYYENVIKVIRGLDKPLVDGHEGLKSLKLLSYIYESSQKNRVLTV